MGLKQKIAEGFTHSYLRTEQKIVVEHLRCGRLDQEKWQEHLEELEEITEKYLSGQMAPRKFLERREQITKDIRNNSDKDIRGLTREEAHNLYQPVREKHKEVLKEAHTESTTTPEMFYKTLTNKLTLTFTQFRNI